MTLTIEILNEKALPLLRDLEQLDVIRIQPPEKLKAKSFRELYGSIPPDVADDFHRQLDEMRNEWERDIWPTQTS